MAFEEVSGGEAEQFNFDEPGKTLTGVLVEHSEDIDGEFGVYQLWKFDVDGTTQQILAGGILLDKLNKSNGNPGDAYQITFKGLTPSKKNPSRKYKDWGVAIDRRTAQKFSGESPF